MVSWPLPFQGRVKCLRRKNQKRRGIKMWVRAKQTSVNSFIISGFHDSQKRYAGDVFEISDEEIEADEVVDGQKTGKKIKRLKYFSNTWMEKLTEEEVQDHLSSNKNYAPPVYKRRGSGPRKFNKDMNVI